jgi:hypothetical protein
LTGIFAVWYSMSMIKAGQKSVAYLKKAPVIAGGRTVRDKSRTPGL